jgi:hypothetical protein
MNEEDADRIVSMIESHWGRRVREARPFWMRYLVLQDAELVTLAVAKLAERQTEFPKITDLRDMLGTITGSTPELPAGLCRTCLGDKVVLVQTRPAKQSQWMAERGIEPSTESGYEECVPCPDCNAAADTSYSVLGKDYVPMDEPTVRQRMEPARTDPEEPRTREVPDDALAWLAEQRAKLLKRV